MNDSKISFQSFGDLLAWAENQNFEQSEVTCYVLQILLVKWHLMLSVASRYAKYFLFSCNSLSLNIKTSIFEYVMKM